MPGPWLKWIFAGATLSIAAACAGDSSCVEAGLARCAAICACSDRTECVVTSSTGLEIALIYEDLRDCEVLVTLECRAADDVDPYPECPAALPAATCATVFEDDDADMASPFGGLVLPDACR